MAALAHYKPTRTLSFCVCAHNRTRLILAALAVVLRRAMSQLADRNQLGYLFFGHHR
jgi:hypothetical protein